MSDQEDFDQQLTPSQEHSIAFAVILLFGAMYLFFMKGCQPIASSIGQAFGPPQTVQVSSDQRSSAVTEQSIARDALQESSKNAEVSEQSENDESEAPATEVAKAQAALSGDAGSPQANVAQQAPVRNDAAAIKAEAASLAMATAAQKLADEKRYDAKQAELQAAKAELAIPAKPIETASTSSQASPEPAKPSAPAAQATEKPAESQATKPFNMDDELARDNFTLPDGRSVEIPAEGFENSFKKSILQGGSDQSIVFDRVYFYPGSDLLNPESSNQILGAAGIMNTYKDINVKLRGHTDSTGPAADNLTLSFKRSLNLKKQLVGLGIDTNRIQVEGLGSSEPISDNESEKGRNKNRRIDLTIIR